MMLCYGAMSAGKEKPILRDIDNFVVPRFAAIWMELGKHLNIEEHLLRIIVKNNAYDCERSCSKMLSDWLDMNIHASWGELIDAVDKLMDKQEGTIVLFIKQYDSIVQVGIPSKQFITTFKN